MSNNYGISDADLNIVKQQAARRAAMRKEFFKQSTNPWKHASEAGYVFDPAIQKFMSMKVTQFDHFKPNMRNSLFGICVIVVPMFAYGYLIWNDREKREHKIRTGELRYRDRDFKLA
ncbi:unnamed protein product [Diatraea saccharalis]|uniref:NADH dehydrogenase [ubiquinone] 1 beta subcomplex subunit 4 n=1 Tax=Diatraea saccharalis TaxID=40085 RepID=A0A9N9R270_9NEOP|nr:unnamed protein product [Diatraea saccharalis]